jgi:hypothetical protein
MVPNLVGTRCLAGSASRPTKSWTWPREEAERVGHRYLGPEHVLLGVLA